jgi:glycosyltransferase involved in cell wall biosynthesis
MKDFKNLKIATIYGQGIEGCGVTRGGVELELWADKTGATVDMYALSFKKYARSKSHEIKNLVYFAEDEFLEIAKTINEKYDIVIFNNYPNFKFPHKVQYDFYHNFYMKIQKPIKAIYIHEIHKVNIDKLTYLIPVLYNADIVFHFDTDTWFSKTIDKLNIQKINKRLFKYILWINLDDLNTWRLKYKDNKTKGIISVTRWSSLKNVRRSIDLMAATKKLDNTWHNEVYGIERSIGAKVDILDYEKAIYVNTNGTKVNEEHGEVCVYGPVARNVGIDLVASHTFASSFFSLPKKTENYGNRMEYTQIEIIGAGTIPVFDLNWAQHNTIRNGTKYVDIPYSAIYTDGSDIPELAKYLVDLSNNEVEMQKYLDTSYELIKNEFDADKIIPETIELIFKVGKNPNQKSIYDIYTELVHEDYAKDIIKLEEEGKIPALGIGELENKTIEYLSETGKQVPVKKYKYNKNNELVVK